MVATKEQIKLIEVLTPDVYAECYDGVSNELDSALWLIVAEHLTRSESEYPEPNSQPWFHLLTYELQKELFQVIVDNDGEL